MHLSKRSCSLGNTDSAGNLNCAPREQRKLELIEAETTGCNTVWWRIQGWLVKSGCSISEVNLGHGNKACKFHDGLYRKRKIQTSSGGEPWVSDFPNYFLTPFRGPWFNDSIGDMSGSHHPTMYQPHPIYSISWNPNWTQRLSKGQLLLPDCRELGHQLCLPLDTHGDISSARVGSLLAFRLENTPSACCRRLSRAHGCHLTPELSPGNRRPSLTLCPWNVHRAHCSHSGSHFQGRSLERVLCYWDQIDWTCDWTQLRPLYKRKILASGCRDLPVLQGSKTSKVSSLLVKPASYPAGVVCLIFPSLLPSFRG